SKSVSTAEYCCSARFQTRTDESVLEDTTRSRCIDCRRRCDGSHPGPVHRLLSRVHNAISNASNGSSLGIDVAVRQPTMRRENTSVTNAVNAIPVQVGT